MLISSKYKIIGKIDNNNITRYNETKINSAAIFSWSMIQIDNVTLNLQQNVCIFFA